MAVSPNPSRAAAPSGAAYRKPAYLSLLRELVTCFQAFERLSSVHIRSLGLTPPQFDIIATLGNTAGMTCSELGAQTLITKGTLTGILDRLQARGLLQRVDSDSDRRSTRIELTAAGQALFDQVFPVHVEYMRPAFERIGVDALRETERNLVALRESLRRAAIEQS